MSHKPYRVIFMGTPAFAVPSLKALLASNEEVVAVVTQPDRPAGRGRQLSAPPVKEVAEAAGIPVLQPTKIRTEEFLETLRNFAPDIITVTAYGRILPGPLLNLPPLGTINVHGSLLPKYRGAAPVQWAVLNGESEAGITIMQMDEGLDTGDILLPGAIPIGENDTAGSLAVKLADLGGQLLVTALERLHENKLPALKQDDTLVSLAPLLTKEQGLINWQHDARTISCQIRGLDPWPCAYTLHQGKWLRLFAPKIVGDKVNEVPGVVSRTDAEGVMIATGENYLLARELQLEGGRRMPAADFLRGRPIASGTRLGL